MREIYNYLKGYLISMKRKILIFTALCILSSITSIVLPLIFGNFIDVLITAENNQLFTKFIIIFGCVGLISILLKYILSISYGIIQTKIAFMVNRDVIEHIQKTPLIRVLNIDSAYMTERINTDSNTITIFILSTFQNLIGNIITILSPIVFIFSFDLKLGMGIVVSILLYYIAYGYFKKPLYKINKMLIEERANFFSRLNEQISYIEFIKVNSLYREFLNRINSSFVSVYNAMINSNKLNAFFLSTDRLIMLISQVSIYIYGGLLVSKNKITIGQFTIVYSYYMMIINSSKFFFILGKSVQENLVSLARLTDIRDIEQEKNGSYSISDILKVQLSNLEFSYDNNNYIYYQDYIFRKGYTYAIVGNNGSGKSTLIKLILGLFSAEKGDIYYNNIPIKSLDILNVRKNLISIVEQDPILLADSFDNNISLLDSYEVDNSIRYNATKLLFPNKNKSIRCMETSENIENELSGGERQKITLIRALTKKPKLLILDEPTSALDNDSSKKFLKYIEETKEERITIIITHDDNIANHCDYKYNII